MGQHRARRASGPAALQIKMHELLAELTSGDDTRAEKSIPAIVDLGMAAIPALFELTLAEEVDSRWWAVRALAASPDSGVGRQCPGKNWKSLGAEPAHSDERSADQHPHYCFTCAV